jgi:hypothetical protein
LSQFILSMPKFANNHLEEEIVPDYEPAWGRDLMLKLQGYF